VHEVHRHARIDQLTQRAGCLRRQRAAFRIRQFIVSCPVLEQVAEHVQRLRAGRLVLQEAEELLGGVRTLDRKMQVGDEERPLRHSLAGVISCQPPPWRIR